MAEPVVADQAQDHQAHGDGVDEEFDEEEDLKIVHLPDLVLVKVFSYLELSELYQVALTCHRLNEIMCHPAAWATFKMTVLSDNKLHNERFNTANYQAIVERFGPYIQNLDFTYTGYCQQITAEAKKLIDTINTTCRLKSLVISVHFVETAMHNHSNFNVVHLKEHYEAVCSLAASCESLRSFALRSWPDRHVVRGGTEGNEILEALCANNQIKKLQKLHMFWPDRTEKNWAARRTNQTKQNALDIVKHFTSLTHLSLPSNMMSQELLNELNKGNRTPLKNMRILVVYSNSDDNLAIPNLSWEELSKGNPELEVEVVFNSRVPDFQMSVMLKSHMPVSTVYFMKYARCNADDIYAMVTKYHKTLKKFISYADTDNASDAIRQLVYSCKNLHTLVFCGTIEFKTAMEIAEVRGKKWYQFCLKKSAIDLNPKRGDPDEVIKYDAERDEYVQVALHNWGDTEESLRQKEERMKIMIESITQSVGWKWQPFEDKGTT